MGVTIQFESHKVELWAIYAMEYDAQVLEYFDQSDTLTLTYQSPSGRTVVVSHTPDFLVLRQDSVGFEEWKQEERLRALAVSHPGRYQHDPAGRWCCPPGEEAAARLGLSYHVRSSAGLHPTYIRNLIFLEDYFFAYHIAPDLAVQILEAVEAQPGLSLAALLQTRPHITVDAVYALIARGGLYVDLCASPLKEHPHVQLYPDQTTAEAHVLLLTSRTTPPWETPSEQVRLVAARTAVCTASAIVRACRKSAATSPTSRYPSSRPVRSTVGTTPRIVSQTVREYSRYTVCCGRTNTTCGQRRNASAQLIAEWMPNFRAA